MEPARIAVILNPVSARSGRAARAVRAASRAAGLGSPLVLETTVEEPGTSQARYAAAQGCGRVVVVGGDGTVRLVAGALAEHDAGHPVTLGVVPVGTANLFARSARLRLADVEAAARLAVSGTGRPTDLGMVEFTTGDGTSSTHPFLVVAGLGHDAETLASVRPGSKSRLRWLAYFLPGLGRLLRPGHLLEVTKDGQPLEVGPLWSLLAVNAARLPAGAQVVPGAALDDGILHVALVSPRGPLGWLQVAGTGLAARPARRPARRPAPSSAPGAPSYPRDRPALAYRRAGELVVGASHPVLAQVDGDVVTDVVRARITLRPGAVLVAR